MGSMEGTTGIYNMGTQENDPRVVKTAGTHRIECESNRSTRVEYNGELYDITENFWRNEDSPDTWTVALEYGQANTSNEKEFREFMQDRVNIIEILGGLGYSLDEVETEVAFWKKEVSEK